MSETAVSQLLYVAINCLSLLAEFPHSIFSSMFHLSKPQKNGNKIQPFEHLYILNTVH